jgi:hypothetical protein
MVRYFVIGGRQGGKTAVIVRAAVSRSKETGMPVAVTSEFTKFRILEEAARQGVVIPDPIVVKPNIMPSR